MDKTSKDGGPPENQPGPLLSDGQLADLDFDFEDYFTRARSNQLRPEEWRLYSARIYGYFCKSFYKSDGDPSKIPKWVAQDVADRLFMALNGAPWNDIMDMPWDEITQTFSPIGQRAFDIYSFVCNSLKEDPKTRVTTLLGKAAELHNVSYETARTGYYAILGGLDKSRPFPDNFLI